MVVPIGTPDVPFDDPIGSRPVVGFRIVIFSAEISTMKISRQYTWLGIYQGRQESPGVSQRMQ